MDAITIILIIVAIIVGFLVGKYITERIKWSDKKKLIESEWKLRMDKLENEYKTKLLEMEKNKEIDLKKLSYNWQMKYSKELAEIKELIQSAEKYMRKDAVKRSRRTLLGKLWEQVSPYIPKFPYKPSDMKFLGAPIDFVIFDGMGEKDIKKVVFLEVKSGDSKLNTQERKLKKVIQDGKVTWKLFNVEKPEKIKFDDIEEEKEIGEMEPQEVYKHIDNKIEGVKEVEFEDSLEDELNEGENG